VVEWDSDAGPREGPSTSLTTGVFIARRDSSSRLNTFAGGRLFPGMYHHAKFNVEVTDRAIEFAMRSDDGEVNVELSGSIGGDFSAQSIFTSLDRASQFFAAGSLGYSPGRDGSLEGMELQTARWEVESLSVKSVRSSFFEDQRRFPPGSAEFDCALLMRGIPHEWHQRESICGSLDSAALSS
jgi:hypothetical protein